MKKLVFAMILSLSANAFAATATPPKKGHKMTPAEIEAKKKADEDAKKKADADAAAKKAEDDKKKALATAQHVKVTVTDAGFTPGSVDTVVGQNFFIDVTRASDKKCAGPVKVGGQAQQLPKSETQIKIDTAKAGAIAIECAMSGPGTSPAQFTVNVK